MGEKLLLNKAAKIAVEDIVQKVMDIFEAEDGRVFEENKKSRGHFTGRKGAFGCH